jgi:hypothetical protein
MWSSLEVLCLGLAERRVALGRAWRWELLAQAETVHAWRGATWGHRVDEGLLTQ